MHVGQFRDSRFAGCISSRARSGLVDQPGPLNNVSLGEIPNLFRDIYLHELIPRPRGRRSIREAELRHRVFDAAAIVVGTN
jgi:hypothetical protein